MATSLQAHIASLQTLLYVCLCLPPQILLFAMLINWQAAAAAREGGDAKAASLQADIATLQAQLSASHSEGRRLAQAAQQGAAEAAALKQRLGESEAECTRLRRGVRELQGSQVRQLGRVKKVGEGASTVMSQSFPCTNMHPPLLHRQGEAGSLLQHKEAEILGLTREIQDLKVTVALLHDRIEAQQKHGVAQASVSASRGGMSCLCSAAKSQG